MVKVTSLWGGGGGGSSRNNDRRIMLKGVASLLCSPRSTSSVIATLQGRTESKQLHDQCSTLRATSATDVRMRDLNSPIAAITLCRAIPGSIKTLVAMFLRKLCVISNRVIICDSD